MKTRTMQTTGIISLLLSAATVIAAPDRNRWHWSNPLPHGNNVMDMQVSGTASVQVGDSGSLHFRGEDERWVQALTGTENYLRSTTVLGERFIAVGESGTIIWSDSGTVFQSSELVPENTLDWFEGVAASSLRAVAVGDYGAIYTSTNGVSWTSSDSGTTEWLRGVAFGGSSFVAVGENGTILQAPVSAGSWSAVASGTTEHLNRVRYLGNASSGNYYAVGNNGVLLNSSDGTAWTALNSGSTNDLYDVALNSTGLLLVGDQELRLSRDGATSWEDQIRDGLSNAAPAWVYLSAQSKGNAWWAAGRSGLLMEGTFSSGEYAWQASPSDSSHAWLWDMTVQSGIYIAVGDLANIKTSLDGILWTQEVVPVAHTNTVLLGVGGNSNVLVAVGNDGAVLLSEAGQAEVTVTNELVVTNITVETYGVVWTNLAPFTASSLQGIDVADDLFIATGDAGSIFTSSNGWNWTARNSSSSVFLSGVAIGADVCVAVGDNGSVLRSADRGISWSAVNVGTTDWLYRVQWLENQFVIVGEGGSIFTSVDGLSWTAPSSGTDEWLTDVSFADGEWFVSGYHGTLLTSTNLTEWESLSLPTGKSLFVTEVKDGQLLVAGVEGVILRNRTETQLTPVMLLDYSQSTSTDTNGVDTVYELFLFGGQPDQIFGFCSTTNLTSNLWNTNAVMELYDPSGTLYAIRTRDATNAPPAEFYSTQLVP
ncbi:hypothetical protein P4C99_05075 [Pontiellaceae bacterium B1224]|nr:hypothetical protein [Pontiellaceae bacterium B1224]